MEQLFNNSRRKIERVSLEFQRFLHLKINWKNQLIAIKGARGSGKTTLLLQHIKQNLPKDETVLYISMDELFFNENSLISLAEKFYLIGGKFLFLDEVHKYPNWSREIKLIYDNYPDIHVVFTSSSILEIYKAESDLSRRAVTYELPEMSLREFLEIEYQIKKSSFTLSEITQNHQEIALELTKDFQPIAVFNTYLKYGAYPYSKQGKEDYYQKLINTINLIIEVDILSVENIDFQQITKIKKLLFAIATSVPFTPNITKIADKVDLSRQSLIKALHYLEKARLLILANKHNKGMSALSKPEKIYLNNTNLIYCIAAQNAEIGNLRETFFINQLSQAHQIALAENADFLVNNAITFEIGGISKKQTQIKNTENAFVVKDNLEYGSGNTIPLWLFGFLY